DDHEIKTNTAKTEDFENSRLLPSDQNIAALGPEQNMAPTVSLVTGISNCQRAARPYILCGRNQAPRVETSNHAEKFCLWQFGQ
ncbi:UNVERIFIED_CONTAM: hypothetical protein NY603_21810, partial [Bacteroidetes bacterium 56_B9]